MRFKLFGAALLACATSPALAQVYGGPAEQARPDGWFVRAGPAEIWYHDGAKIGVGGKAVPGASLRASDNTTVEVEGGYYFNPNVSVSMTVGVPPTIDLYGTGALAGSKLGRVTYAPAVAATQYHLTALGSRFRPYAGAGIGFAIVLKDHNRAIRDLHVSDLIGVALQGGVESRLTRRLALFVDVKKLYFTTNARGSVQGDRAMAKVRLDPTILSGGVSVHF